MIEQLLNSFTIVVPGTWNTGVFSPEWLGNRVFDTEEVSVMVSLQPGLPRRLTAQNVTVIPAPSQLMLVVDDLADGTLVKMEKAAVRILRTLEHTPVSGAGVNFGYKLDPISDELSWFVRPLAREFADRGCFVKANEYGWAFDWEGVVLNLTCRVAGNHATYKFNFHKDVPSAAVAAEHIEGKLLSYRDKSRSIMTAVFGLDMEANS
jgi:hypothetical protein